MIGYWTSCSTLAGLELPGWGNSGLPFEDNSQPVIVEITIEPEPVATLDVMHYGVVNRWVGYDIMHERMIRLQGRAAQTYLVFDRLLIRMRRIDKQKVDWLAPFHLQVIMLNKRPIVGQVQFFNSLSCV